MVNTSSTDKTLTHITDIERKDIFSEVNNQLVVNDHKKWKIQIRVYNTQQKRLDGLQTFELSDP